jgi:hypothetical protein
MGVFVKTVLRAVFVVAFLVTAQLGYGGAFDRLLGASPSQVVTLREPATLVALGLALLLFAGGARRKRHTQDPSVAGGLVSSSQKKASLGEPQGHAA